MSLPMIGGGCGIVKLLKKLKGLRASLFDNAFLFPYFKERLFTCVT